MNPLKGDPPPNQEFVDLGPTFVRGGSPSGDVRHVGARVPCFFFSSIPKTSLNQELPLAQHAQKRPFDLLLSILAYLWSGKP